MKKALTAAIAACLVAPLAHAGVPSANQVQNDKWMRISPALTVDTEDIDVRGDRIRFWVRRNPVGNEEMSTQSNTSWTGKIRIRCGDFHRQIEVGYVNKYNQNTYYKWPWERIGQNTGSFDLASNFCYLTGTPGYTPEPIVHAWQRKITETIKAGPKKKLRSTRGACDNGTRHPRCD